LAAESTASLLAEVRAGNDRARDRLAARYLPFLKSWAHLRLPAYARDGVDTDDLVQQTLMKGFGRLDTFEPRREGAFLAYLRQILINEIRMQIRRVKDRRPADVVSPDLEDDTTSPLERVIRGELLERYEAALERLPALQREAIFLRLELGFTYDQIAEALGKATWNSARMTVSRALLKLGKLMDV
jgi:RNA polymerase sigma-70 factor (ECF subfamily)